MKHPKYRHDIDGLRAIAVLLVVGYHAFPFWIKGGFIGVDIFFVISGFLISTILFENLQLNKFNFLEFYGRRIRRIFPSLIVVLVATFVAGWLLLLAAEYQQLGKHILGGAGFLSNIILWNESGYFDTAANSKPLLHLWSLGIEEQFYLFWPLILWSAWKKRLNLLTLTVLFLLISYLWNIKQVHLYPIATFYLPQTRFWELLAGSVLAYVILHHKNIFHGLRVRSDTLFGAVIYDQVDSQNDRLTLNLLSLVGFSLLVAGVLLINQEKPYPGSWALLPILGTVMMICAGAEAWLNHLVLSNRLLIWIGLISFPLYLWHWPLLVFAQIVIGDTPSRNSRIALVLLAFFLSWVTYVGVEKPCRFGKNRKSTTVILMLAMVLIGFAGYLVMHRDGLKFRTVVKNNINPDETIVMKANGSVACDVFDDKSIVQTLCKKYPANGAKKTIVLWGDSSIGAWLPVFLDIAVEQKYTIIAISHPSCPPILGARKTHFEYELSRNYCTDGKTQAQVLNYINAVKPDLTVMIAAWNAYSFYSNREFITTGNDALANSQTTRSAIENQLPATLNSLLKKNKILVFRSWPILSGGPNYAVKRTDWFNSDVDRKYVTWSDFSKDNALVNSIFEQFSGRIQFYSPTDKICNAIECHYFLNGVRLYADTYHITPFGAMQFKSDIEPLLR